MKKLPLLYLIILIFPISVFAQSVIDSLVKVVEKQKGKEKVITLSEICFQYSGISADKAIEFGNKAVKESYKTEDSLLMAQAMNDLSLAYLVKGSYDSAISLNQTAYRIRIARNEKTLAAASLSKIASAYYYLGKLDKSIQINFEVFKLYEGLKDIASMSKLSNNIGALYEKNGNYPEATKWFNKSIAYNDKQSDYATLINAKTNLALVNKKLNNIAEAEKLFLEVIPMIEAHSNHQQLTNVYQGLGIIYEEKKDYTKALEYYEKTLAIFREINNEAGMTANLANVGNMYSELKEFNKASKYLQEGLQLAQKAKSFTLLQMAYSGLYRLEKKRGNYQLALNYFENWLVYHDSIYNSKSNELLAEMNARYETQEKEKALLLSQSQLAEQKLLLSNRNMWIAITSALLVVVIALIFVLRLRHKNRQAQLKLHAKEQLGKERLRISRDLHDNIGADLTWISSELDSKAFVIENKSLQEEFSSMGDKTRAVMKNLRETIWAIHNEKATPEEIVSRLKEQTKQLLDSKGVVLETNIQNPDVILGPNHTLHLYRICKEAINNSVKHSNCTIIKIDSTFKENILTLKIEDNGKGFQINTANKGYGLNNMEERTKEMGGQVKIDSNETGTSLIVQVPVSPINLN